MKTLVIVAHPELHTMSRIHKRLVSELNRHSEITVHDLYAVYSDEIIDVAAEQKLLLEHDRIVLQFPFWWYSAPYLLKKWTDTVLTFGWAYGPDGNKLHGKELGLAISTGSEAESYSADGYNRFDMLEMTRPYQATSAMIGTRFMPLFTIHNAIAVDEEQLGRLAADYARFVQSPGLLAVQ